MLSPDPHSHRQKVPEGSASNVCGTRHRWTEEDYFKGLALDVALAYDAWVARRRAAGDLTIETPKQAFHRADYVKGQGPQTAGDAGDKSHTEGREEDGSD